MIYSEEPIVTVGILSNKTITFSLTNDFLLNGSKKVSGTYVAELVDDKICLEDVFYSELLFVPIKESSIFTLQDVVIGLNFHWQRKEDQTFKGSLRLVVDNSSIYAINEIKVENYLYSVISSEMRATSSLELLKAHAVISRSWLLSQIINRKKVKENSSQHDFIENSQKIIRWYERSEHTLFDVCADDHCQRYQGLGRAISVFAKQAIDATRGEVLTYNGELCDARFSKCCGGVTENFEYCWDNIKYPYLKSIVDTSIDKRSFLPDLTKEAIAEEWIKTSPKAFCNTKDKLVLRQVLNDYDQETTDFYRWEISYTQTELSSLLEEKLGIKFGQILSLNPLKRGKSGRLYEMEIEGTERSIILGKELEIRRVLSKSHLYSSAFVVEKKDLLEGVPQLFKIVGAGWGHGVGLCQIGAAVMGAQGYDYKQILSHYYSDSVLTRLYH
ncbi:SpoIID/LytB domain-containing protein [Prevotella amnii]|uniref:Amidase n=2 Tax=Prevotella amnii TaxID=419005 RepID=A0A096B313_9BACT|nr:SpoIID/LytB domain-containing protein [Prevotella amnii]KGF53445.1 amidase [Prevotella amnii DNF00058]KXB74337.1 SpoIID/LytB domain protein [Prevotella amnii]